MHSLHLLHLLKQHSLLREAQQAAPLLTRVLTDCLQADKEEVMIITDTGSEGRMLSPLLAGGYFLAAQTLGLEPTLLLQKQKSKGEQAEQHIETMLDDSGFENIIILVTHSLGSTPQIGKSFRKFTRARKHKFISCTGLSSLQTSMFPRFLKAIDIDYLALRKKALFLKKALDQGEELHLTTPAGTDLWVRIKGKEAYTSDGYYKLPGTGGNLPTGEVYIASRKKKVEGRVVIDGSSRHLEGTALIKTPITLTVEKGEVTDIQGGREASLLEESLQWAEQASRHPWGVRRLGEFGLGINPRASIIGAMILDEKTLNTAHVAIGSNHWFGGTVYAIIHLDQVLKNPEVRIDGKPLDKSLYT